MNAATTLPAPPDEGDEAASEAERDFEIARRARIERLREKAARALDLHRVFIGEAHLAGEDPFEDHRVISAARQVQEYYRAIKRLRAMTWLQADALVMVALREELLA